MSESAAKEYQIEEALTKMESAWTDIRLEIVGYRETGTGVLKGVDDINTVLDEQVNAETQAAPPNRGQPNWRKFFSLYSAATGKSRH